MADTNLSAFLWSVADLLRGDFKQADYGKAILPFTALRRVDRVREPTRAAWRAATEAERGADARKHREVMDALTLFRPTWGSSCGSMSS